MGKTYLDSDILYALMKENDYHRSYAIAIVGKKGKKYTSVATLLELEIIVKRDLGDALSLDIGRWVKRLVPSLKIVSVSELHFEKSLELRQKHGLGIFDSLHAAVCLEKDGEMASTDHVFDRVNGLKRLK